MQKSYPQLKIGAVCIGDELLRGFTVNTNLSYIGKELLDNGYELDICLVIKDNKEVVKEAIKQLISDGIDIVIMTGGLGPTLDDITKNAVAEYLDVEFIRDEDVVHQLNRYWSSRGHEMPETVLNQSLVPEGSYIFPNEVGTAPGLRISIEPSKGDLPCVILLPGPPVEMNPMFSRYVMPYIKSLEGFKKVFTKTLYTFGIPESKLEKITLPLIDLSEFNVAYCASPEGVKIYLSAGIEDKLISKYDELRNFLEDKLLTEGFSSPVEDLVYHCLSNNITLSTAESCTGGMIASAITEFPGVSSIYKGSVICYSNEWKHNVLGVSEKIIEEFGAVSKECAAEMVENLCIKYKTDAGISVTGIAGPGGGTEEKKVGLVFIGVQYKDKSIVEKFIFPGNRKSIRIRSLNTACRLLKNLLDFY